MSTPLLTIAIPTYNRAQQLDRQLAWAIDAIAGRWDEIELLVSDNASPDDTPQICERQRAQSDGHLTVIRQATNVGLIRNVLFCIEQARGQYVWVVGDDDAIFPGTLEWVLHQLAGRAGDKLSFLHLNVRTQSGYDGAILQERVYPFQTDREALPGSSLFEECVEIDENWMLLITANIYAADIARAAIRCWPQMTGNLAFPLFLSGYAAAQGQMIVRSEPSLLYPHHTGSHLRTWLNTVYHDIPAAYLQLLREGYSPAFIRRRILSRASFLVFMMRFPWGFLRSLRLYFAANRLQ